MTRPGDPRTGRKWLALVAYILDRDTPTGATSPTCWRCGNPGADTGGHVLPWKTHPHLALDPDNLRAEHGKRRTLDVDGYDCRGNYSSGADAGQLTDTATTSKLEAQRRDWLTDIDAQRNE